MILIKLFLILIFSSPFALIIRHYVSLHKKNKILMEELESPAALLDVDSVYATVVKKMWQRRKMWSPLEKLSTATDWCMVYSS